jgi:hypothetical protein
MKIVIVSFAVAIFGFVVILVIIAKLAGAKARQGRLVQIENEKQGKSTAPERRWRDGDCPVD